MQKKRRRKLLAGILSLALLISTVPYSAIPASAASGAGAPSQPVDSGYPQLILNSGFENGTVGSLPDHWSLLDGSDTANGSAALSQDAGFVGLGKSSLKMTYKGSSTYGVISDAVKVKAGESYRLNMHSKSTTANNSVKYSAYVNFYDAGGTLLGKSPVYGTSESTGWQYVTTNTGSGILAATAPANAVSARYVVTLGAQDTSTDAVFYFDRATLIHLDKTVTSVLNSGFENDIDTNTGLPADYDVWEWTDADKGTQVLSTEKAYEGTHSVKLSTVKGAGSNSIRSYPVAAQPGTDYNFSVRIFTVSGGQPLLRACAFDINGAQIAVKDLASSQTNTWEKVKTTWTAPANTAYVAVMVYQNRAVDGVAYIDNMSVIPTAQDQEDQISASLLNPGFENGAQQNGYPLNWNLWPGNAQSTASIDTATVHTGTGYTGTHSLKLVDSSTTYTGGIGSEPVQVIAGKKYRATAWVYNESASGAGAGVALYMNFYKTKADAAAGSNRLTPVPNANCSQTASWQQVTVEGVAPEGAACATIGFYQSGAPVTVSYLDDVNFVQVPDVVYSASLQNPGFEDGTTDAGDIKNWGKYNSDSTVALSADVAYEGGHSVKLSVNAPNATGCGVRSDPVAVTPGINYQAKAMVYNKIGTSQIYLEFWKGSDRLSTNIVDTSRTGKWQEITAEGVAPAGATYATILFYQQGSVSGITYADSFSLAPYTGVPETPQHFTPAVNSHPKVFFTDVASLRAKANDAQKTATGASGKEIADQIIASADKYLPETGFTTSNNVYGGTQVIAIQVPPVDQVKSPKQPSGSSNYPFWTEIARGLEDRMEILSMAYNFTGNEAYARKAVDIAVAMAGWQTWHDPEDANETTNLDTAHIVFGVSAVYDMCYQYMTADERLKLQSKLVTLGLDPLYADAGEKVDHNIQVLRTSALTTGALALMGDVDSSVTDKYLTRSTNYFKWYLNERAESGNQEGFGYASYALENMVDAFDQLARVTGSNDLVHDDFLNNTLVNWIVNFSAPGSYALAKVSDYDGSPCFYQTLSVLANNGNGLAGWYLANANCGSSNLLTKQFLYLNKNMPVTEPAKAVPNSAVLNQIGWGAMRTGWQPADTLLGLISNNTGLGHNHYDQNSFLIATNGTWIANDPGYSTFDNTKKSLWDFNSQVGHNTILVDWVKNTTVGAQVYKGGGSLTSNIATPSYSYMIGSAPEAYGDNVLSRFDRHAIMVNHSGRPYFVLFDDLNSAVARTYTWSLFAGNSWDEFAVDGKSVSNVESSQTGSSIKVSHSNASLYAQFIGNSPLQIDTGMYQHQGDSQQVGPYIHVSNPAKAGSYNFMSVLNTYSDGYEIPASVFQPSIVKSDGSTAILTGDTALFRGEGGVGSEASYTFNVSEDGKYDVSLIMPKSFTYGIYQIAVDGVKYGEPCDGYNATVVYGNTQNVGQIDLKAGKHTVTFTCTGKNDAATKTMFGITAIKLKNLNANNSTDSAVPVSETIDNANALGAKINYTADAHDLVLFNRTASAISEADVSTNAKQVSLVGVKADGSMEGAGMNRGTSLAYGGKALLTSTAPVSVYVDYTQNTLTVNAAADADVTLYLKNGPVTMAVKAGSSEVSFAADYSAVDSALAKVPADLSKYTNESVKALQDAVAAVVRSYDSSRQNDVNAMAAAIEKAIGALVIASETPVPVRVTDGSTGVVIEGEAGVLPSDTTLAVTQITQGVKYETVKQLLGEKAQQFTVFDILLLSGGKEIEPNGKVKVTMPIPAGYDSSRIVLYHIADDGTAASIAFTVQGGNIVFTAESFSMYAIAELRKEEEPSSSVPESSSQQPESGSQTSPTSSDSPATGDHTGMALYVVLMLASLAAAFGLIAANKQHRSQHH